MNALATMPSQTKEGEPARAHLEQNKYFYPEFAGLRGERYVRKLLRQILSLALYRTWEILAEQQARDQPCYLGLTHLANLAQRTPRTLQKNLATLLARHLMIERAERRVFRSADGTMTCRAVVVKDFSPLYSLAHEYHEWLSDERYVPAERSLIDLLRQDQHLLAKVRRFENYRRVLFHHRPGPPARLREDDRWFTDFPFEGTPVLAAKEVDSQKAGRPVNPQQVKDMAENVEEISSQRINESERRKEKGESFDSAFSLFQLPEQLGEEHMTEAKSRGRVRSEQLISPTVFDTQPPWNNLQKTQQLLREEKLFPRRLPYREEIKQHPEIHRDREVRNLSPFPPASMTDEPPAPFPDVPLVRSFVQEIAPAFGDRNTRGSITRVLRLLTEQGLREAEALCCLVRAYTIARDTSTIRPQHCDYATGRTNRMPLFCALFERFARTYRQGVHREYSWQNMKEDLAVDDRLARWWSEHWRAFGERTGLGSDAEKGVCSPEPICEEAEHSISPACSRQKRHSLRSQTIEERTQRAVYARRIVARLSEMAVAIDEPIIWWEHMVCGCPLFYHTPEGKTVCALCFPDPAWPEEVRQLIHSIVGTRAGSESEQAVFPETGRWTKREEAYTCGIHVLKTLAERGYTAEMTVRPTKEWYQIVLASEGHELVLETSEQALFLIEQVRNDAS